MRYLELIGEEDGNRRWRFLTVCPEVLAGRSVNVSPPYAVEGDELSEDQTDGDATPYRLWRGNQQIGNPEHWQVRHLLPASAPTPAARETSELVRVDVVGYLRRFTVSFDTTTGKRVSAEAWEVLDGAPLPHPAGTILLVWNYEEYTKRPGSGTWDEAKRWTVRYWIEDSQRLAGVDWRAARARILEEGCRSVGIAARAIPGTPVEAGDAIVIDPQGVPPRVRGRIVPLTLEGHHGVRAAFDAASYRDWPIVDSHIDADRFWRTPTEYFRDKKRWGLKRKVWTPYAFVVKGVHPSERWSVRANSDDAAIFELLSEVGCRMPAGAA